MFLFVFISAEDTIAVRHKREAHNNNIKSNNNKIATPKMPLDLCTLNQDGVYGNFQEEDELSTLSFKLKIEYDSEVFDTEVKKKEAMNDLNDHLQQELLRFMFPECNNVNRRNLLRKTKEEQNEAFNVSGIKLLSSYWSNATCSLQLQEGIHDCVLMHTQYSISFESSTNQNMLETLQSQFISRLQNVYFNKPEIVDVTFDNEVYEFKVLEDQDNDKFKEEEIVNTNLSITNTSDQTEISLAPQDSSLPEVIGEQINSITGNQTSEINITVEKHEIWPLNTSLETSSFIENQEHPVFPYLFTSIGSIVTIILMLLILLPMRCCVKENTAKNEDELDSQHTHSNSEPYYLGPDVQYRRN